MKKSDQADKVLKKDTVFILDEGTRFLCQNADMGKSVIISSHQAFTAFLSVDFQVRNVVVLVELDWDSPLSKFQGYQMAKDLMTSPQRQSVFNLVFFSAIRREVIFKIFRSKNRIFTQKFAHRLIGHDFDLLKIKIPQLSEKKFDYLKNYCLLESGILDRLEHDLRKLQDNPDEWKLQKFVQDMRVNSDILTAEILAGIEKLSVSNDAKMRRDILKDLYRSLRILQDPKDYLGETAGKRSHASMMLIEDDSGTLEKLKILFDQYFYVVKAFQNGTEAFQELEKNAKQYDVVVTDMELLNGDFDDDKQGIDILELCEENYGFITTRVITSLPKNALKRLIGKGINEIVFKSGTGDAVIPPFENIGEFIAQIEKDVQKKKLLRTMDGPVISWWGSYLTRQLYIIKAENNDKYDGIWREAMNTARRFIDGDFDDVGDEAKLSSEFKQANEVVRNPAAGWEIIERLLAHRLIALWFAAKHSWNEFYYTGDGVDVYTNLPGFQFGLSEKAYKSYFNTFLGLSVRERHRKCQILKKNLFPEEENWLLKINAVLVEDDLLRLTSDLFHGTLMDFMRAYDGSLVDDDIRISDAADLLNSFCAEYTRAERDQAKHNKLRRILTRDFEEYAGDLTGDLKAIIDRINADIFCD